MAISIRGGNGGGSASATTITPSITSWPIGSPPQPGDLVLISGNIETTSAASWSQTGGTGSWTFHTSSDLNSTPGGICSFTASRIFDGTETAPTFTTTAPAGMTRFIMIALTPDAGNVLRIDAWSATFIDTIASTSHTGNPVTAQGSGEVSVLLNHMTAAATGTTAITTSGQTGWTNEIVRQQAGTVSTYSQFIQAAYQLGVSGTVTPTALPSNVSTVAVIYHVLVFELPAFAVAKSTPTVTDPVTSAATVTDPRDGTASVSGAVSVATVT